MYHYTYLLVNTEDNRMYIGKRSCDCKPSEDYAYMSSSKYVPKDKCVKFILQEFNTAKEAIQHEVYLHKKYDVANNDLFYNKACQTSTGFDTTGCKPWNAGGGYYSQETRRKMSESARNKPKEVIDKAVEHNLKPYWNNAEIRKKASESLKKNGSNKGIKNSQFKPWFISYSTVTHLFYDISKNEKALQDGFTKKYYTDTAKTCKRTNLPVTNRRGDAIFVGNIPN